MTRALVDTNVLVYSTQSNEVEKKAAADREIAQLASAKEMAISIQNLAEFSRVLLEKVQPPDSKEKIIGYVEGFSNYSEVLPYSPVTVKKAVDICSKHKIHFFDALLAATMLENSVFEIITENTSDFEKVPGIRARNPFLRKDNGFKPARKK